MRPLAYERSKLFDQEAERYDRCRPSYPDALIEELLGLERAGLEILDVGCGTGIASRQMAARGAKVLGVELAPRMAAIARSHGIEVELGAFEGWDAAGRTFDRVTSAQAWHWLDLPLATSKAASLLRPGGRLCLIWNAGSQPDDLADALEVVYASVVPSGGHRVFRGYAANRSTDVRTGLDSELEALAAVPDFAAPTIKWFSWTRGRRRAGTRIGARGRSARGTARSGGCAGGEPRAQPPGERGAEDRLAGAARARAMMSRRRHPGASRSAGTNGWTSCLFTRSDHTALEPEVLERLLEGIGTAIEDQPGRAEARRRLRPSPPRRPPRCRRGRRRAAGPGGPAGGRRRSATVITERLRAGSGRIDRARRRPGGPA